MTAEIKVTITKSPTTRDNIAWNKSYMRKKGYTFLRSEQPTYHPENLILVFSKKA